MYFENILYMINLVQVFKYFVASFKLISVVIFTQPRIKTYSTTEFLLMFHALNNIFIFRYGVMPSDQSAQIKERILAKGRL